MKFPDLRFVVETVSAVLRHRAGFAMAGLIALSTLFSACSGVPKETTYVPAEAPEKSNIYLLRVGDIVQVDVFQEPGMTTRQRIQGDGTISVGLIGRVSILGEAVQVAGDKIAK